MTILIIVLLVLVLGGVGPWTPYGAGWGYGPVGIIALVLVLFLLFGRGWF